MKTKHLLVCLLLILISATGFSQETESTKSSGTSEGTNPIPKKKTNIKIGPKFGLDLTSSTDNLNSIINQLATNYQAGLLFQYGKIFYIQPEIYYASYKLISTETTQDKSINYIKIPALLGLRFLNLGLFSLHVMGGPVLSLQLDDKDSFNGLNTFSWQVGAGIDVLGFITGDLRYTMKKGVSIGDQVSQFTSNPTGLNLTVGLKL